MQEAAEYEFSEFFNTLSKEQPQSHFPNMNEAYVKWRFFDNPNFNYYRIFSSQIESGELKIISFLGFKDNSGHWLSLYASNTVEEQDRIAHINEVRKILFSSGVKLIHAWLFECNSVVKTVKTSFLKSGFSKVREGLWIVHNSKEVDIDAHDLYFSGQLGIR